MKFIFVGLFTLVYLFNVAHTNPDLVKIISELHSSNSTPSGTTTLSPETILHNTYVKLLKRCKRPCRRKQNGKFQGRCSDPGRRTTLCLFCRYTLRCGRRAPEVATG